MPVKSDAHENIGNVSGCHRLPGVASEELHEGAKVMFSLSVCAVADTESSVVVLEIGLHLHCFRVSDSEAFFLGLVSDWTDSGFLILSSGDSANNTVMFGVYVQSCSGLGLDTL